MLLEWSTSIDSRDFVHILCKQLSCTSPPLLTLPLALFQH